ncbi:MAG: PKD domain-containing protein [Thermogutta sp.]
MSHDLLRTQRSVDGHANKFPWLFAMIISNPGMVLFFLAILNGAIWNECQGQNFRRAGQEFPFLRPVEITSGAGGTLAVVEFYHHGQIDAQGKNVIVGTGNDVVPTQILQLGPGDFCRLAFQVTSTRFPFEILYGGPALPDDRRPQWNNQDGLLWEVKEYRDCNLNSFESVKAAFESSRRIGADYVSEVFQAGHPFFGPPGPYMGRYSGVLHISQTGTYGFYTSSQDCSFLLIDGKVVASAPGRHPPSYQVRPGLRQDVQLTAGPHHFEYYHVSTTEAGIAVAAWEINPSNDKPAPAVIPGEAFRANIVLRAQAGPAMSPSQRFLPNFEFTIVGAVPLPDRELPLLAVRFTDRSPPALVSNARIDWDFGDGQTSQGATVDHVFLRPGVFAVKETITRAGRPFEMTNRVWIGPSPTPRQGKQLTLDELVPVLETYQPEKLDALSLLQLVTAFSTKADQYLPPPPPDTVFVDEEVARQDSPAVKLDNKTREAERRKYLQKALDYSVLGLEKGRQKGDQDLLTLLRSVALFARDVFADTKKAVALWTSACDKLDSSDAKLEAYLNIADIYLNDLLDDETAKVWLDKASLILDRRSRDDALASLYQRIMGDYWAAKGNQDAAIKAYREADRLTAERRNEVERTAWRGAYSRSTEQFVKSGELDRAASELRQWLADFPGDTIEGYLPVLFAKYWFARRRYDVVCALADRLLVINPYSPYMEELLLLSAQSDLARGQPERAKATLESLLKDYPGSELVSEAKALLQKIKAKTQ